MERIEEGKIESFIEREIKKFIKLYKENESTVRMSIEVPDGWSAKPGEPPSFEGFKGDMLFDVVDIASLYNYIAHPEDWIPNKHFVIESIEIDGNVQKMFVFPFQQENSTKIALKFVKYLPEKETGIILFPLSYQPFLKYYLRKFLNKEMDCYVF
jgi:hypothetical protein